MGKKHQNTINRKEFIKRSVNGLIGAGLIGISAPVFIERINAAENIRYRPLGKTGLNVTAVGLGGSRTNEPGVVKRAVDMGINFIDTGRMYAMGKNEEMIGAVIKDVRKNIIIQSKIDQKIRHDRDAMTKSIENSLKALRTDYIDIMLIRGASSEDDVTNPVLMEVFTKAKESGKIRLCGFSSHSGQSHKILKAGVETGFYDVAMVPYNHAGNFHHSVYGIFSEWDQDTLEKEIENAVKRGMGIVVMKTCSAGPLKQESETRGSFEAALRWVLKNKNISSMAVGMGSFREVSEDVKAMS